VSPTALLHVFALFLVRRIVFMAARFACATLFCRNRTLCDGVSVDINYACVRGKSELQLTSIAAGRGSRSPTIQLIEKIIAERLSSFQGPSSYLRRSEINPGANSPTQFSPRFFGKMDLRPRSPL
jgi:hypothetical protein